MDRFCRCLSPYQDSKNTVTSRLEPYVQRRCRHSAGYTLACLGNCEKIFEWTRGFESRTDSMPSLKRSSDSTFARK